MTVGKINAAPEFCVSMNVLYAHEENIRVWGETRARPTDRQNENFQQIKWLLAMYGIVTEPRLLNTIWMIFFSSRFSVCSSFLF